MTSLRLGLLAGLLLPLSLATASLAQPAPDAPPPPPAGADAPHHHHDPAERRAHMAEHLRDVLQLTAAQEPALNALLDAMAPPHHDGMRPDRDHDGDDDQALTTPARLDRMLVRFDEQRTRLVAHVQAIKAFYAQLSPAQQKAFDDLGPMMMMGGGMHHGMMGGDHGMGDHDGMHHHHGGPDGDHGDDHDGDHAMGPGGPPQG